MIKTEPTKAGFPARDLEKGSDEWWTPPHVFEALGVDFDLDPCSPGEGLGYVPALHHYTKADDGVLKPWFGRVWCNPPYSEAGEWIDLLAAHGDGIALTFARTDTRWAQRSLRAVGAVCFIAGRLKFELGGVPSGAAGAPSMLWGFGDDCADSVLHCGLGVSLDLRGVLRGNL